MLSHSAFELINSHVTKCFFSISIYILLPKKIHSHLMKQLWYLTSKFTFIILPHVSYKENDRVHNFMADIVDTYVVCDGFKKLLQIVKFIK